MKSNEWDRLGFKKHTNPSGEVIRTKTYWRGLIVWDNESAHSVVAERKKLAELLQVPWEDLLADLEITVEVKRHPRRSRRFLKYLRGNSRTMKKSCISLHHQ